MHHICCYLRQRVYAVRPPPLLLLSPAHNPSRHRSTDRRPAAVPSRPRAFSLSFTYSLSLSFSLHTHTHIYIPSPPPRRQCMPPPYRCLEISFFIYSLVFFPVSLMHTKNDHRVFTGSYTTHYRYHYYYRYVIAYRPVHGQHRHPLRFGYRSFHRNTTITYRRNVVNTV